MRPNRKLILFSGVLLCAALIFAACVWNNVPKDGRGNVAKSDSKTENIFYGSDGFQSDLLLLADYKDTKLSFKANMEFLKDGETTLSVKEPEFMSGFSVKISDDGARFILGGVEIEVGAGEGKDSVLFAYKMAKTLYGAMSDNKTLTEMLLSNKDGVATYQFTENIGDMPYEFKIRVDTKEKKPLDIVAAPKKESVKYTLTFENFEFVTNTQKSK